jgi:hypothetical protein
MLVYLLGIFYIYFSLVVIEVDKCPPTPNRSGWPAPCFSPISPLKQIDTRRRSLQLLQFMVQFMVAIRMVSRSPRPVRYTARGNRHLRMNILLYI